MTNEGKIAVTFENAFAAALSQCDLCYAEMRGIMADPEFVNRKNRDWTLTSEEMQAALDLLFRLKDAWLESRYLLEKRCD